jgi:nicotinate-nucleotide adenylyltransferase
VEFFRRSPGRPSRLGILPGTFNPLTVAHVALGQAALPEVTEVVFVLPRVFPHKEFAGASFEERIDMLLAGLADWPEFSVAAVDAGLFIDIARECRAAYGRGTRLSFLCGRDAAERIAGWDYGRPDAFREMLCEFDLLVAARAGEFQPPAGCSHAVRPLTLPGDLSEISASEVRERVARGGAWEELVPVSIRRDVRRIYARERSPR